MRNLREKRKAQKAELREKNENPDQNESKNNDLVDMTSPMNDCMPGFKRDMA